jgi:predicted dehydrogenase
VTLRVGIIGYGGAGGAHDNYFAIARNCRVTKILDTDPAGLERARRYPRVRTLYSSEEGFWDDLDVVSICTPDRVHAHYAVTALSKNIHVLSEKPLTDSYAGMRRMLQAEAQSKATAAVLHQMRFVPLFHQMKQAILSGELGRVSYLEGYYVHNLKERAFKESLWRFEDNATPLIYAGCHFVDLLRWLVDDEIVEVYAAGNHFAFPEYPESDLNVLTMKFGRGGVAKVLVSFGSACPQDHSVRVYGSAACIDNGALFDERRWVRDLHRPVVTDHIRMVRNFRWFGRPRRLGQELVPRVRAGLADRLFRLLRRVGPAPNDEYGVRHYPVRLYEHRLACVRAIEDLIDAIDQGRAPLCTFEESAKAVAACVAGVKSLRTGLPVRVPTLEDIIADRVGEQ